MIETEFDAGAATESRPYSTFGSVRSDKPSISERTVGAALRGRPASNSVSNIGTAETKYIEIGIVQSRLRNANRNSHPWFL